MNQYATPPQAPKSRLIVGITGASGVAISVRILELLRPTRVETHLVISKAGEMALAAETDLRPGDVAALADIRYPAKDVGAAIASGSFRTLGMVIAPCTIKSASEIATGVTSTLLTRAADVTLKEQRKLVLMVRESPLHLGHLRTMAALSEMGAIIAPPVPAFYLAPKSVDDIVTQLAARTLDMFGIDVPEIKRWKEEVALTRR